MTAPSGPPPGWYTDPQGSGGQRWWDGSRWTEHVQGAPPAPQPSAAIPTHTRPGRPRTSPVAWIALGLIGVLIMAAIAGCWRRFNDRDRPE